MRILIVRHGDPDYAIDGLTEKGKIEVELLSRRLVKEAIGAVYVSPLGRAKRTAAPTLEKTGLSAEECSWLREFDLPRIRVPYLEADKHSWDLLPEFMEEHPALYDPMGWREVPFIKEGGVPQAYDEVCAALDALLARHGYRKEGLHYRAERSNHDTILLVCHFGVTAVLLSHLLHCSPYSIWQHTVTLPSSVTTVYTEERQEGIAAFRCAGIGDLSHLYVGGEEEAFAGRFCECFADETRH